jgi:hypothetical protein
LTINCRFFHVVCLTRILWKHDNIFFLKNKLIIDSCSFLVTQMYIDITLTSACTCHKIDNRCCGNFVLILWNTKRSVKLYVRELGGGSFIYDVGYPQCDYVVEVPCKFTFMKKSCSEKIKNLNWNSDKIWGSFVNYVML